MKKIGKYLCLLAVPLCLTACNVFLPDSDDAGVPPPVYDYPYESSQHVHYRGHRVHRIHRNHRVERVYQDQRFYHPPVLEKHHHQDVLKPKTEKPVGKMAPIHENHLMKPIKPATPTDGPAVPQMAPVAQ